MPATRPTADASTDEPTQPQRIDRVRAGQSTPASHTAGLRTYSPPGRPAAELGRPRVAASGRRRTGSSRCPARTGARLPARMPLRLTWCAGRDRRGSCRVGVARFRGHVLALRRPAATSTGERTGAAREPKLSRPPPPAADAHHRASRQHHAPRRAVSPAVVTITDARRRTDRSVQLPRRGRLRGHLRRRRLDPHQSPRRLRTPTPGHRRAARTAAASRARSTASTP